MPALRSLGAGGWSRGILLALVLLAFLWFRLIDHLRVEWALNPQYAYGWAVPFLCAYLAWRNYKSKNPSARPPSPSPWGEGRGEGNLSRRPLFSGPVVPFCFALMYAPTRLVQEANPEWRLVSWLLAIEVLGLTLWLLEFLSSPPTSDLQSLPLQALAFPIGFFLVAVPWPTVFEAPLIQGLTRAVTAATIELLGLVNIPAVQHGNVIEISKGLVGIDDACSGIRSFQATVMICLFLGEIYRLSFWRRLGLVAAGPLLAFMFNVGRTFFLVRIAAGKGIAAMGSWHDPAGVTILVACFLGLWGIAALLKPLAAPNPNRNLNPNLNPGSGLDPAFDESGQSSKSNKSDASLNRSPSLGRSGPVALAAWMILVEGGTELWYRLHERNLPAPTTWQVKLPQDNPTLRNIALPEASRRMLRFDEALDAQWSEAGERKWQAIFLRWNPGRTAVHLAKSHTPEVCLTAAGRELVSQSEMRLVSVDTLKLPFRSYLFKNEEGPLRVYYCLWDDRATEQSFETMGLSYANRLAPVLAGRRNPGQRSLELALWGVSEDAEAKRTFEEQIRKLVRKL